ncbi:MAG: hypothetical protein IKO30_04880 [Lachnospiraceae bacterium]|nr:hypothetical protein [Lachnospiraceae bacterium]
MKKRIFMTAAMILALAGCSASENKAMTPTSDKNTSAAGSETPEAKQEKAAIYTQYPYYDSIESFMEASEAVVVGKVKSIDNKLIYFGSENPTPHYLYTVRVEKCFKGNETGEIKFLVPGGEYEGVLYTETSSEILNVDDRVFLGLSSGPDDCYTPVNMTQGFIKISEDDTGVSLGKEYYSFDTVNYVKHEVDRIVYDTAKELAEASDLIVIGTFIEDVKKELISDVVSHNTIRVDKVIKGNAADTLKICQRYAYIEETNSIVTYSELKPMIKGDSWLFFLKYDETNDCYWVTGDSDGRYPVPPADGTTVTDEMYGVISENALSKNKALYPKVLEYLDLK